MIHFVRPLIALLVITLMTSLPLRLAAAALSNSPAEPAVETHLHPGTAGSAATTGCHDAMVAEHSYPSASANECCGAGGCQHCTDCSLSIIVSSIPPSGAQLEIPPPQPATAPLIMPRAERLIRPPILLPG
ncbi:MAG TPA: hypothetical protein VIM41_07395 [Gammaproteobacteria bacterium]